MAICPFSQDRKSKLLEYSNELIEKREKTPSAANGLVLAYGQQKFWVHRTSYCSSDLEIQYFFSFVYNLLFVNNFRNKFDFTGIGNFCATSFSSNMNICNCALNNFDND